MVQTVEWVAKPMSEPACVTHARVRRAICDPAARIMDANPDIFIYFAMCCSFALAPRVNRAFWRGECTCSPQKLPRGKCASRQAWASGLVSRSTDAGFSALFGPNRTICQALGVWSRPLSTYFQTTFGDWARPSGKFRRTEAAEMASSFQGPASREPPRQGDAAWMARLS